MACAHLAPTEWTLLTQEGLVGHRLGEHAAFAAHGGHKRIRLLKEAFGEHVCCTMTDDAVAFHLSKTKPPFSCASLYGLTREYLHRTTRAGVLLVEHHVFQTLIIGWTNEDFSGQRFSRHAIVERLATEPIVAVRFELVADLLDRGAAKGRRVSLLTVNCAQLSHEALHELPDRHAARNGVRVDDNVGYNPVCRHRHVGRVEDDTDHSLLSVTRTVSGPTAYALASNVEDACANRDAVHSPRVFHDFLRLSLLLVNVAVIDSGIALFLDDGDAPICFIGNDCPAVWHQR